MNKKISIGIALSMCFITATVVLTITMIFSMKYFDNIVSKVKEREIMYSKIAEVDGKIRQNYLGEIDEQILNDNIARGMAYGIGDNYAEYYNSIEYKELLDSNKGETVGIGIEIYKDPSGYIKIIDVYNDTSAFENGILSGDVIKKIEGKDVLEIGYNNAIDALKGEPNTKVNVIIQREGEEKAFSLTRRVIVADSVTGVKYQDYGYVRIKSFNEKTPKQFIDLIENLKSQGVKGFVFDVRNNGGGLLTSVTEILDYLLPEGDIVSAVYKDGTKEVLYTSDGENLNYPMVVLANGSTASAAELFVAALKDYEKAISVGTTTFGKGVMQQTFNISDGSAIRLTIAQYNPPKSGNYDGVGIKADFEVKLTPEQEADIYIGGLESDVQFAKTIEILKSR
ncbi:MAG: S41 family peptidase [Oscillospiraceae bacterium]